MTYGAKALVLTLLVSMTGCAGEEDDGTNDDVAGESEGDDSVVAACGLPEPCEGYNAYCRFGSDYSGCGDDPYPEPLVCMLEALAVGEPAQLHVSVGELEEWLDIAVYGPDAALYQYGIEYSDYTIHHTPPQQCSPKPAEWFQACLADAGDEAQHIACMNPYEWFEGCVETAQCL
jgi:hypothetical protein